MVSVVLLIGLYLFAVSDFSSAFKTLRFVGIGVSSVFVFICFNECFYLIKEMKVAMVKMVRLCDVASLLCTAVMVTMSVLFESWVLYDIMASCICVGCIKLFYF